MNTKQTPEERPKIEDFIDRNLGLPTIHQKYMDSPELFKYTQALDGYIDSLSTEIERLRKELKFEEMLHTDEIKKLNEIISGKTFSCPVCDSMAERNKELESAIEQVKNKVQFQSSVYSLEINSICEQLLSKQNNKK